MKKRTSCSAVLEEVSGSQAASAEGIPQQHQTPYAEPPIHRAASPSLHPRLFWHVVALLSATQALT